MDYHKLSKEELISLLESKEKMNIDWKQKLFESESLYKSILESSPDVIVIANLEGIIEFVSDQAKTMYGFDNIDLFINKTIFEFLTPESKILAINRLHEMFERSFLLSVEYQGYRFDNSIIDIEIKGDFIRNDAGEPMRLIFIIREITQRKESENKINKLNRILSLTNAINQAIIKDKNRNNLLEQVCNIVIDEGKFRMAWIGMVDLETKKILPVFKAGFEEDYLAVINQISVDINTPEGCGPSGSAMREGKVFVVNDIETDSIMAIWRKEALLRNYHSIIALPIKCFGNSVGVINIYSDQSNFFTTDEINLLIQVIDNIGFGLESFEMESKRIQSENELRKLLLAIEQTPVSIVITNLEGIIEYANPMTCYTTGYSKEELLGQNPRVLQSGETDKYEYEELWQTITSGASWHGIFHNKRKNGDLFWESSTITPVTNSNGQIISYIAVKDDITDRKKADEDLRKFRTIAENANYGTCITTTYGQILFINEEFAHMHGYEVAELMGQNLAIFHNKDQIASVQKLISSLFETGEFLSQEVWHTRKNGSVFPTLMNASMIRNNRNEPLYFSASAIDITERKVNEQKIIDLNANLERKITERTAELELLNINLHEASVAKSEFLSRMSHELRTPMNSILGFAQILEMGELTAGQKKSVNHILKSGKHLLGLINEVLDISRIEAGRLSISIEPINVRSILDEMIDTIRPIATANSIKIISNYETKEELFVRSDKQRLKQILLNLLNNAVKYNKPLGSITLEAYKIPAELPENETVRISITDTGIGISEHDIPKIFTPFERIGAQQTDIEGTGLGLAVVKKLMDTMGGVIGVDSKLGEGSTFWIQLQRVENQLNILINNDLINESNQTTNTKRGKILYIEDNSSNIELVEQILHFQRTEVQLISNMNGRQAVVLAIEFKPNLILLDLNLPDIHGSEVLTMLKTNPITKAIPVVVVSADAMQNQIKTVLQLGANHYLTKPLDVPDFLRVIDELIL